MPKIEVKNLYKVFGSHLNRLPEPTAGTILLDGQEISRLNDQEMREVRKNKISMVFQHFGLLPNRTEAP